jgi:anti-sigma factor RsiW
MSMNHEDVRARLSALMDLALPDREAADVETHLRDCAACRTQLAQLRETVRLLREVEPVQVPEGFAFAVRSRIEQMGAASPARPPRRRIAFPQISWSWRTAAAAASVVLVGLFAANLMRTFVPRRDAEQADQRQPVDATSQGKAAPSQSAPQIPGGAPAAPPVEAQRSAVSGVEPSSDRKVIRAGEIAVEVDKFDDAARRVLTVAEAAGGFVADSSYDESGGVPRGVFVVRVPANRFAETVRQLEQLGAVQRRHISGQDVTEEFIDLEARVRNLERQEARLLTFLDRATKVPDLLAVQQEVSRVRGDIERLKGRMTFLSNRVDLATVRAQISQKPKKRSDGLWDLDRTIGRIQAAFVGSVRDVLGVIEGIMAFAAAALPLVILGGVGWGVVRRSARRAAGSM